jgi:hypothetical protein
MYESFDIRTNPILAAAKYGPIRVLDAFRGSAEARQFPSNSFTRKASSRGNGGGVSYRDDSTKVASQGNNLSKTSKDSTTAVRSSIIVEALESGARNRAARVAGVELIEQPIDASVPGLSFSRGVLVLLLSVLPWLLLVLLGLLLVLLGLLLVLLRSAVLGRGGGGQGGNSGDGELHCDSCWMIRE